MDFLAPQVTYLRDYMLLLFLLSPLPASLSPSKPCKTTRTAAFPHKSLACSWGKLDTTTELVPSAVTRTRITKTIITTREKKVKTKAASGLTPCRMLLGWQSSSPFFNLPLFWLTFDRKTLFLYQVSNHKNNKKRQNKGHTGGKEQNCSFYKCRRIHKSLQAKCCCFSPLWKRSSPAQHFLGSFLRLLQLEPVGNQNQSVRLEPKFSCNKVLQSQCQSFSLLLTSLKRLASISYMPVLEPKEDPAWVIHRRSCLSNWPCRGTPGSKLILNSSPRTLLGSKLYT